MDFDEYVAARHGALLRAAVLMGCAPSAAHDVVDTVLALSARGIRHSEDPDPLVHEALATAIPGARRTAFGATGDPELRQELLMAAATVDDPGAGHIEVPPAEVNRALVAVLAVLVAFLMSAAIVGPDRSQSRLLLASAQVPSLFAYDDEAARALLTERGISVVEQRVRACDPGGRVVGSHPSPGAVVRPGDTVTIRTSAPSVVACLSQYPDRAQAWPFIDFATGRGPAPTFAPMVWVSVDGAAPTTMSHLRAVDRDSWHGLSAVTVLAAAAAEVRRVGTAYRVPELAVAHGTPPALTCGVARPGLVGDRAALSITIAIPGAEPGDCPARVDLYQSHGAIDTVILYTSKRLGAGS